MRTNKGITAIRKNKKWSKEKKRKKKHEIRKKNNEETRKQFSFNQSQKEYIEERRMRQMK